MPLIGKLKIEPSIKVVNNNFKENVINVTQQIPKGKVTTYGTIAAMAGTPRGARIVGGILHYSSNEFNLPWQRVVNRHGFISTRCEGHTKQDQKEILEQEGVVVSQDFMVDLEEYGWWKRKGE